MGERKCGCGGRCAGKRGVEHKRRGQIGVTVDGRRELGLVGIRNKPVAAQPSRQMKIWRSLQEVPSGLSTVATIGIFDGVHKGHRRLLKTVIDLAKERSLTSVALTFDPHPTTLHRPDQPALLIHPLEDRLHTLEALGIDACLVCPYNWDLALFSARQFVEKYFVQALGAKVVVVGADVRFGAGNSGDLSTLQALGAELGFEVVVIADEGERVGERYSSTQVRKLLAEGQVEEVQRILGRPYRLRGVIEKGLQRGRQIGFPTANLQVLDSLALPADGVYAGFLVRSVADQQAVEHLPAAISVGSNPQFDGQKVTVEAHVLGRGDLNLYGENMGLDFVSRLRSMQKFESVEALLAQMDDDLRSCAQILNVPAARRIPAGLVKAQPQG